MEAGSASISLLIVLLVSVGVYGECSSGDNDNLLSLMYKEQVQLREKVKKLELAAIKEKLKCHEETNKLHSQRTEEKLALLNNKIPGSSNNDSFVASAFLTLLDIAANKLQRPEESDFSNGQERITENLSRLIANSIPTAERDTSYDNVAITTMNNRLNEIAAKVDTMQSQIEDLASSVGENNQEAQLNSNISTSHKGLEQVHEMIQGLQEKVQELTANRNQLQLSGMGRDTSQGLLRSYNFTNVGNPRYCHDYYIQGERQDGVYEIYPGWNETRSTRVWCEFDVGAEVGWTIILARFPTENPVNFSVSWDNYKGGIGDADGEYWIGLSVMHEISISHCSQVLHINLQSWDQTSRHAQYKDFSVGDEESGYMLTIGRYSGDANDAMAYSNARKFTTIDKDNDSSGANCAGKDGGGFWYNKCYYTNPFAVLRKKGFGTGIRWNKWLHEVNLKKITWKIAPRLPHFS